MQTTMTLKLPKRSFKDKEEQKQFLKNAIIVSFLLHLSLLVLKMPETEKVKAKPKMDAIKMTTIAPSKSYLRQKALEKMKPIDTGVSKVTTTADGPTGTPNGNSDMNRLSKRGSPKNGPASSGSNVASSGGGTESGYSFGGKGLKALMGNSANMAIASGSGEGRGIGIGSGKAGKGNGSSNLAGEYRAPSGTGDGSGHLLGKDTYGAYDRSTSVKGIANKKGIETAFVQADTVVMGSIEPEILRKILQEYLSQFKFCYQQELQENSEKLKGIVDLNFRIEGDGKVSKVTIKSANTRFSDRGIGCMSNVLRMIEFPKPKGGGLVDVRQPLNFQSESTKI